MWWDWDMGSLSHLNCMLHAHAHCPTLNTKHKFCNTLKSITLNLTCVETWTQNTKSAAGLGKLDIFHREIKIEQFFCMGVLSAAWLRHKHFKFERIMEHAVCMVNEHIFLLRQAATLLNFTEIILLRYILTLHSGYHLRRNPISDKSVWKFTAPA